MKEDREYVEYTFRAAEPGHGEANGLPCVSEPGHGILVTAFGTGVYCGTVDGGGYVGKYERFTGNRSSYRSCHPATGGNDKTK